MINSFYGMELIKVNNLTEGSTNTPRRRSKSKRIQKKFIKKYGCFKKPDPNIYCFDNKIFAHSTVINKIIREINKR